MFNTPKPKSLKSISLALLMMLSLLSIFAPMQGASAMSMDTFLEDPPIDPRGQPDDEQFDPAYWEAIQRTAGMVWDDNVLRRAAGYGLDVLNVTWEDTGRYYNSAVGPNISDVTIQVQHINPDTGQYELTLMPVIRFPNFTDLTADIPIDEFYLLVGNERGNGLERISLENYLGNFRRFLSEPDSWEGRENSLLASRDSHVLVSAQAAFLPIPRNGKASFNPVIFNYQSYQGDPAVLTIVATREGGARGNKKGGSGKSNLVHFDTPDFQKSCPSSGVPSSEIASLGPPRDGSVPLPFPITKIFRPGARSGS